MKLTRFTISLICHSPLAILVILTNKSKFLSKLLSFKTILTSAKSPSLLTTDTSLIFKFSDSALYSNLNCFRTADGSIVFGVCEDWPLAFLLPATASNVNPFNQETKFGLSICMNPAENASI